VTPRRINPPHYFPASLAAMACLRVSTDGALYLDYRKRVRRWL
jgi:hypothetical protein